MNNKFEVNVISRMSICVVTIPVSMKGIHESIVEFLKMFKFWVKNTAFHPKMGENEEFVQSKCHQ